MRDPGGSAETWERKLNPPHTFNFPPPHHHHSLHLTQMPEINGFRCWIEDAATTECFPEYMTFKEDAHTVTTFITSQPGKQFRINCSRALPTPRVTFKILIGDKEIRYPAKTTNHLYHYQSVVGQKRTHTSYAPFVFKVNCVSLRKFLNQKSVISWV